MPPANYRSKSRASKSHRNKPRFTSQQFEVTIESLGAQGDGIAQGPSGMLYVSLGLPGDRVRVETTGTQGDGVAARIVDIIEPSPHRVTPPCPYYGQCGGCSLQHAEDGFYQNWKQELLGARLFGPVQPMARVAPGLRRRAEFAYEVDGRRVIIGFQHRGSHQIVDVAACLLTLPEVTAILAPLRELLPQVIKRGSGDVTVTQADNGLDVVISGALTLDLAIRERLAAFAETHDLARLCWRQPQDEAEPVAARRAPIVQFGASPVEIPPAAFLQPSAQGEALLTQLVLSAFADGPKRAVADLYAGSGTFSLPLAALGHRVHAVEGAAAPLAALNAAARRLSLPVTTECRDLARRPLLQAELSKVQAVVFDPPRAGAAPQVEQLVLFGPPLVVAVSCNPNTLARDVKTLIEGGYRLERLTPVDQFPYTAHLEAVAVLRR